MVSDYKRASKEEREKQNMPSILIAYLAACLDGLKKD